MPLLYLSRAKSLSPPSSRLSPEVVIRAISPFLSEGRKRRIEQVVRRRLMSVTVVLENLYDPHNGAAVLRTCEALGLLHVHVIEGSEPFSFSRKVSKSAHKWLNVYRHSSSESCLQYLRSSGFICWAAVPPAADMERRLPARREMKSPLAPLDSAAKHPLALVFGNEHAGLSDKALSLSDQRFAIPLPGFTESLNLSVAVGIALEQAVGRRRHYLGQAGDLAPDPLHRLRAAYYALSTAHAVPLIMQYLAR